MAIRLSWQKTPSKSLVNGATRHIYGIGEEASTVQRRNQAAQ
ncbi:MAG TPA: hypothetical protein VFQ98_04990 [Gallionella sp.]|nr:hypothetical protein [Gallionella sp.]